MSLNPFIKTQVDTASEEAVNASRQVSVQIVAPSPSTLTVGQVYEFTNKEEALAVVGTDFSKGNIAPLIIEELYKVQDSWKIFYTSCGKNADSVTTTTTDGALAVGDKVVKLTSASGFATGDYVTVGSGATQEYRKILDLTGVNATVNALDFAHLDDEAVTKITTFDTANLATCRTALASKQGELYIEDSYGDTQDALIKTYLNAREVNELFTIAFRGFEFGETEASAKADSLALNSKYVIFNYGLVNLADKGLTVNGVFTALKALGAYGSKLSRQRVENRVPISMNNILLVNVSSVVANDDGLELTNTELDALVNNYVTGFKAKRVKGVGGVRVYKMVTSYNKDGSNQVSTTYTNIVDISAEVYMRKDIATKFDEWLVELGEAGDDLTTTTNDQVKAQAKVQGILDSYDFLDRDSYEPTVTVNSEVTGQLEFVVSYKTVESADQITFTFAKQIR